MFLGFSAYLVSAGSYGLLLCFLLCFLFWSLLRVCLQRPGVAWQRPDFFCFVKRNRGKKRRRLQRACPAELAARLQRFAQTAAGNMKDTTKVGRDACARGALASGVEKFERLFSTLSSLFDKFSKAAI